MSRDIEDLFSDELDADMFHDALLCDADLDDDVASLSVEQLKEAFRALPKAVQDLAFQWGLSDTVFRDEVAQWMRDRQQS